MRPTGMMLSIVLAAAAPAALAQPAPTLKAPLAGIGFLVGDWTGGEGKVLDTGGTSTGASHVTVQADGWMLLRQDHNQLFDAHGKPAGGFSQVMVVYPEGGTLRADYADGEGHVIHYVSATVTPGRSVVFNGAVTPGQPTFRLAYALTPAGDLAVEFGMAPPGGGPLHPIASGVMRKAR